jgi:hypothetical protein
LKEKRNNEDKIVERERKREEEIMKIKREKVKKMKAERKE